MGIGGGSQKAKKAATNQAIKDAETWSPDDNWKFNLEDIPTDQNPDDFAGGMLELSRDNREVTKKYLKSQFPLVYTEGGDIRKNRAKGGKPFLGPDGKVVLLSNGEALSGGNNARPGNFAISILKNFENFASWKENLFYKEDEPSTKEPSTKKRKTACSSSGSSANQSLEDDENSDLELEAPKTPKAKKPSFKFKVQLPLKDFDKNSIEVLKEKLERRDLTIKNLEKRLNISDARDQRIQEVLSENIQRGAILACEGIRTTIQNAIEYANYLETNMESAGDYYLAFFEKTLNENLTEIRDRRAVLQQSRELSTSSSKAALDKKHGGVLKMQEEKSESLKRSWPIVGEHIGIKRMRRSERNHY